MEHKLAGWSEIPVTEMHRAKKFEDTGLKTEIRVLKLGPLVMDWLPFYPDKPGSPGALVLHPDHCIPAGIKGVLVYLTCPDMQV